MSDALLTNQLSAFSTRQAPTKNYAFLWSIRKWMLGKNVGDLSTIWHFQPTYKLRAREEKNTALVIIFDVHLLLTATTLTCNDSIYDVGRSKIQHLIIKMSRNLFSVFELVIFSPSFRWNRELELKRSPLDLFLVILNENLGITTKFKSDRYIIMGSFHLIWNYWLRKDFEIYNCSRLFLPLDEMYWNKIRIQTFEAIRGLVSVAHFEMI